MYAYPAYTNRHTHISIGSSVVGKPAYMHTHIHWLLTADQQYMTRQ